MAHSHSTPITLSIAGSDSGGGAGIQADIKAISATGGYACTAITALTAQNTQGVSGILPVAPDFIRQQLDAVFTDLSVQAVKIGMLGDAATIECIADALRFYGAKNIILDPVMVATSGDLLLPHDAVESLKSALIPLADLITPNLYEALVLLGKNPEEMPNTRAELNALAQALSSLGAGGVLLKGGHMQGAESVDVLLKDGELQTYTSPRYDTQNTHGTGCSLSSAVASYCAQGYDMSTAVELGKSYISRAIAHADELAIGQGHGPVHHFFSQGRGGQ